MSTAVVVGSGPNGLAAAITLAKAGVQGSDWTGTGCRGGCPRSTAFTRSTAAARECCIDRWRPTAEGLGPDGSRWRRLFGWTSARFDQLSDDIMRPLLGVPRHPLTLARFGAPTVLPASTLARRFRTAEGRALFGGIAAHAFRPLHYPMTSAIGLGIITAGHRHGWAVAVGGSQSITNALAALLDELGGKI